MPEAENTAAQTQKLDEQAEQLKAQQDKIKKQKRRNRILFAANSLLAVLLAVICTASLYRRYSETIVYEKPAETDENQQKIDDSTPQKDDNQQKTPDQTAPAQTDSAQAQNPNGNENENGENSRAKGQGHFTIYSVGDVFTAENGQSACTCDIRNVDDSTHDIVVSLYFSKAQMQEYGFSTEGMEDDRWVIAQSGLFEPGYQISSIQLNPLPDGSYLPAGSYALTMSEKYYHHETGVLSSYEANIPVTLEVAN